MTFRTALAAILAGALALPLSAQDAGDTAESVETEAPARERVVNGQQFGDWRVTCEAIAVGETACVLSQRLIEAEADTFLAEMLAFWSGDGSEAYMAVRVPNGVFFPSGFAVRPVEAEEEAEQTLFQWQNCSPDLCEALLPLDAEALGDFEGEGALLAGYRPGPSADPLVFRIGIAGLAEGLARLRP